MPHFVEQLILNQDPLATDISFPPDPKEILSEADYVEYFERLEILLAKNGISAETLTLSAANKNALTALNTYLSKASSIVYFKKLILVGANEDEAKALSALLKLANSKGIESFDMQNLELAKATADELLSEVLNSSLELEIELAPQYSAIQQKLDEACSKNQRKKRIENFGKQLTKFQLKPSLDSTLPKRKRNIGQLGKNKISIDTDTATEVQVEIAVETAIEKNIEEQFDDKEVSEIIDRKSFLEQMKAQKFKAKASLTPKKMEDTWDIWMGNISQLIVKPRSYRCETKIEIHTAHEEEIEVMTSSLEQASISLCLIQPDKSKKPTDIYIKMVKNVDGKPTTVYYKKYKPFFNSNTQIDKFLANFYPDVVNNNYFPKEITDEEWYKENPLEFFPSMPPELYVKNYKEKPLGKFKIDATSLETIEEESLGNLKKLCPIKFSDPVVVKKLFPNEKVPCMTREACEKLIEHHRQLQFGLDFAHLPDGFYLREGDYKGKQVSILHYSESKARLGKDDPYAIKFIKIETQSILSADLMDIWLDLPKTSAEAKLKSLYQSLLAPYDSKKVKEFKRYLPILLHLPEALITNFEETIKGAEKLKPKLSSEKVKLSEHLFFKLLDHSKENSALDLLKNWQKIAHFSVSDLNKVLAVYSEFGVEGLVKIKDKIQSTHEKDDDLIFKSLRQDYFPFCQSFLPCLHPNFDLAIAIIKSFSKEEFKLWSSFLAMHSEAVGYDDLYNLARTFQDFRDKIKEKNLVFLDFPPFKKIKSLPTALSRILAILDATVPKNLAAVWKDIANIDLQSNAAIKVIQDMDVKPAYGLLTVPEMQIEASHYSQKTDSFSAPHHYHNLRVPPLDIYKDPSFIEGMLDFTSHLGHLESIFRRCGTQKELERNYYRYIATQPYARSLDFYRKLATMIEDKFSTLKLYNFETRKILYALLAELSSNLVTNLDSRTDGELEVTVQEFFKSFSEISFPVGAQPFANTLRLFFLEMAATLLEPKPSLEDFTKIFSLLTPLLKFTIVSTDIEEKLKKFKTTLYNLKFLKNKDAFLKGINFLDSKKLNLEAFDKLLDNAKKLSNFPGDLLALYSTFHLEDNFIDLCSATPWYKYLNSGIKNPFVRLLTNSLHLLTNTKTNILAGKVLNQEDLLNFINKLYQANFSELFEVDFFTKLANPKIGLSTVILSLIQQKFSTVEEQSLVSELIKSFGKVQDCPHYENTIKALGKITEQFTVFERKSFLQTLSNINLNQASSLEDLYKLLLLSSQSPRGTADFLFVMEHYAKEPKRNISQMLAYFNLAIPLLYGKSYKNLKITELQPLAASLLLYLKEEDFTDKFKKVLLQLEPLVFNFPTLKESVLSILSSFINQSKDNAAYDFEKFMTYLVAANTDPQGNTLRSLCEHYLAKPLELYQLFEKLEPESKANQNLVLQVISSLENNGKHSDLAVVEKFISQGQANSELYKQAAEFFETPPYPNLNDLSKWHEEASKPGVDYQANIALLYKKYELCPCEHEKDNGFIFTKAEAYSKQFKGIDFSKEELQALELATTKAKPHTVLQLQESLRNLKALAPEELEKNYPELLAVLAELLYRSKDLPAALVYPLN